MYSLLLPSRIHDLSQMEKSCGDGEGSGLAVLMCMELILVIYFGLSGSFKIV
jgi:hypothetical protein